MTNAEWMQTMCSRFGMAPQDIEIIMVNQGIIEHETVDPIKAKTALVREFATIIPLANVTEGGYTVSWNMEAIKEWYRLTCGELGITPASTPQIRNRSYKW